MDPELGVDSVRLLDRNKQTVWYALCTGKTERIDENGFRTGQYDPTYAEPVRTRMNIRWDSGAVRLEGFGENGAGKRRIVTDDLNCPITLGSILWIGIEPQYSEDSAVVGSAIVGKARVGYRSSRTLKPNYYVAEVPQKSLTQIVYIIEEVNVS